MEQIECKDADCKDNAAAMLPGSRERMKTRGAVTVSQFSFESLTL